MAIVGVVGNVTTVERFGDPKAPQIYVPFAQNPWPQVTAAVRVATDPQALRPSLGAAVHAVDPDLPLTEVQTMEQIVGERMAPDRLNIALYGGLAALGLLLAALGIYSVMAFTLAQRTSEIGLRMALGAQQSRVRLQLLGEGLTLAIGGLALGLLGAYALGRALQSTLYGTGTLNLPVLLAISLVLLGAALVACYVPRAPGKRSRSDSGVAPGIGGPPICT
jgi:putative ABC transport system permease protein